MLNKEKFKDEIVELACSGCDFALKDGKVVNCQNTDCRACSFSSHIDVVGSCSVNRKNWANSEYEEYVDWSKVPVDTKILVRDHESQPWLPRYFAGVGKKYNKFNFDESRICVFKHGKTSFTASDDEVVSWRYAKLYKEGEE